MNYTAFKNKIKRHPVFSTSMLGVLSDSPKTLQVQMVNWKRKGLVCCLRRGLYVLGSDERTIEPSLFYLANQMFVPSYVSLESALAYHGLIPEFVATTTSVTTRRTCRFKNDFGVFTYQHIKSNGYLGFESIEAGVGGTAWVATAEKAVVDFLYLNMANMKPEDPGIYEKSYRFQNCEGLNAKKLKSFAESFGVKKLVKLVNSFEEALIR